MKKLIVLFIIFIFANAFAADHYVSTTGSATWEQSLNSGTPCSYATANANIAAGDTAIFSAGTYSGGVIHPVNNGTAVNPIVYQCAGYRTCTIINGSTTPLNLNSGEDYVTIKDFNVGVDASSGSQSLEHLLANGCTGLTLDGLYWYITGPQCEKYDSHIINSSNVVIKNCTFDADADYTGYTLVHASTGAGPDLFGIAGTTDVNFYNNIVGTAMHGPLSVDAGTDRIWIHNCHFSNRLRHGMNLQNHTYWVYGQLQNVLIENNYFDQVGRDLMSHPIAGERRPTHSIEVNAQKTIIRNNTFDRCNQAISNISEDGSPMNDVWWYHNTAYDLRTYGTTSGGSGRFIMWTIAYNPFQRNHVLNNLMYGAEADLEWYIYDGGIGTGSSLFYNNQISNNSAIDDDASLNARYFSAVYNSISALQSAQSQFTNNRQIAAAMTNPAGDDFTLSAGSDAIDNGTWLATIASKSGNQLTLGSYQAYAFTAPWPVISKPGDTIYTNNGDTTTVVSIDAHNQITVADATDFSAGESLTVVNFSGTAPDIGRYEYGDTPDTTAPVISNGSPAGTLASGTTSSTLNCDTDENATCKYDTSDVAYGSMANTFSTTGAQSHSQGISGLSDGNSYTYYVRCQDAYTNANASSYIISFSVDTPGGGGTNDMNASTISSYTGTKQDAIYDGCTDNVGACMPEEADNYSELIVNLGVLKNSLVVKFFGDNDGSRVSKTLTISYKQAVGDSWTVVVNAADVYSAQWIDYTADFTGITAQYFRFEITSDTGITQWREAFISGINYEEPPGGGGGGGTPAYSASGVHVQKGSIKVR